MMRNQACFVCESNKSTEKFDILQQCQSCGFIWWNNAIGEKELKEIYNKDYFFNGEYFDYIREGDSLRKNFKRTVDFIRPFISSGKLIDIGCAYGYFLEQASKFFEVEGVDINSDATKYAQDQLGVNARSGDFLNLDIAQNSYDIASMWSTLEHVPRPHLYLEKINKILRMGGYFVCSTPDIDSFVAKLRGKKWRQIHPPSHVSYFSKKTLTLILNKYGFEIIKNKTLGDSRTINHALHFILVQQHKRVKLYQFLEKIGLARGTFYVNLFDQMYVIARKVKNYE